MSTTVGNFLVKMAIIYFVDWFVIVGTIAFAGSMAFWISPGARYFSLSDPTISFPFQHHPKISSPVLHILSVALPVVLIALVCIFLPTPFTANSWRRKVYATNKALLGFLLGIAIAMLVTDSLKNLLGKPRPDLLSRCDPDPGRLGARVGPALVGPDVCRAGEGLGRNDRLLDGFRSFPSGHASSSFAGMTYLTLFLACFVFSATPPSFSRSLKPFSTTTTAPEEIDFSDTKTVSKQPKFPQLLVFLILAIPILLATYIASTRFSDYRHHGVDIIAGCLLGFVSALVGWGWYGVYCCRRRVITNTAGAVFAADMDVLRVEREGGGQAV